MLVERASAVRFALFLSAVSDVGLVKVLEVAETDRGRGGEHEIHRVRNIPALLPREHPPRDYNNNQQPHKLPDGVPDELDPLLPDLLRANDLAKCLAVHFVSAENAVFDVQ